MIFFLNENIILRFKLLNLLMSVLVIAIFLGGLSAASKSSLEPPSMLSLPDLLSCTSSWFLLKPFYSKFLGINLFTSLFPSISLCCIFPKQNKKKKSR